MSPFWPLQPLRGSFAPRRSHPGDWREGAVLRGGGWPVQVLRRASLLVLPPHFQRILARWSFEGPGLAHPSWHHRHALAGTRNPPVRASGPHFQRGRQRAFASCQPTPLECFDGRAGRGVRALRLAGSLRVLQLALAGHAIPRYPAPFRLTRPGRRSWTTYRHRGTAQAKWS